MREVGTVHLPETREGILRAVTEDVEDVLGLAFPGHLEVPEELADVLPIGTGTASAVPWVWRGTHEAEFFDVRPTGRPVEVAGVTILRDDPDGGVSYHRVVDWHTLYRQLGLLMVCRRPRDTSVDDIDRIDLPSRPFEEPPGVEQPPPRA